MSRNYVQGKDYRLAGSGVAATDTSIVLTSMKLPNSGALISMTDFGEIGFITFEPETNREENASFTGITQNLNGTATLTGVTRGFTFVSPSTTDTALRKSHSGGSIVRVTNSVQFYENLANRYNAQSIFEVWSFTPDKNPKYLTQPTSFGDLDLIDKAFLSGGVYNYFVDSGSADTIVITPTTALTAYTAGNYFFIKVAATNTGATTINVNGLGAKTLKKNANSDLSAGDILAGQIILVDYDGTNFQLIGGNGGGSGVGGGGSSMQVVLDQTVADRDSIVIGIDGESITRNVTKTAAGSAFSALITVNKLYGQTFTVPDLGLPSFEITSVTANVSSEFNGSAVADIYLADGSGLPTGSSLGTSSVAAATVFTFGTPVVVTQGLTYVFVIDATSVATTGGIFCGAGGSGVMSNFSGGSWTTSLNNTNAGTVNGNVSNFNMTVVLNYDIIGGRGYKAIPETYSDSGGTDIRNRTNLIGVSLSAGAIGATISVATGGEVTGFTGLTPGDYYTVGNGITDIMGLVRTSTSVILMTMVGGGGSDGTIITATAEQDLTAGQPVGLSASLDDKVAIALLENYLNTTSTSFTSINNIVEIDTDKYVICCNSTGGSVWFVAQIDRDTMSVSMLLADTAPETDAYAAKLDTNKFAVVYYTSGPQDIRDKVFTVSGITATLLGSNNYGSASTSGPLNSITSAGTDRLVYIRRDGFTPTGSKMVAITYVGGTGSAGSAVTLDSFSGSVYRVSYVDTDTILTVQDATLSATTSIPCGIYTLTANTFGAGTGTSIGTVASSGSRATSVSVVSPGVFLLRAQRTSSPVFSNLYLCHLSGASIVTDQTSATDSGTGQLTKIGFSGKVYETCYTGVTATNRINEITVSGTSFTKKVASIGLTFTEAPLINIDSTNGYYYATNRSTANEISTNIQGMSNNFIGIAQSTASRGTPVNVLIKGVDTHQSGLSAGNTYIVSNGAFVISGDPTLPNKGVAKSATSIEI